MSERLRQITIEYQDDSQTLSILSTHRKEILQKEAAIRQIDEDLKMEKKKTTDVWDDHREVLSQYLNGDTGDVQPPQDLDQLNTVLAQFETVRRRSERENANHNETLKQVTKSVNATEAKINQLGSRLDILGQKKVELRSAFQQLFNAENRPANWSRENLGKASLAFV